MQDSTSDYAIPRKHDEPAKLLLWDFDEALLFMIFVCFGIVSGFLLFSIILGLWAARIYSRKKAGKHRMYVVHLMYWYLPDELTPKSATLPPSCTREFIG